MSSVWVKVYIGKNDTKASLFGIHNFKGNKNVDQLKERIKEKEPLECSASWLVVYPPQQRDDNSLPWENNVGSLQADDSVYNKTNGRDRFIVLAPEPKAKQESELVSQTGSTHDGWPIRAFLTWYSHT